MGQEIFDRSSADGPAEDEVVKTPREALEKLLEAVGEAPLAASALWDALTLAELGEIEKIAKKNRQSLDNKDRVDLTAARAKIDAMFVGGEKTEATYKGLFNQTNDVIRLYQLEPGNNLISAVVQVKKDISRILEPKKR